MNILLFFAWAVINSGFLNVTAGATITAVTITCVTTTCVSITYVTITGVTITDAIMARELTIMAIMGY